MFRTMLDSTKFQRVKSLWHSRIGCSKSSKRSDSHDTPVQEVTTAAELDQRYRDSVIDDKVEMPMPRTPTLDAAFYRYTKERNFRATKLYTMSVSSISSSLTSASADSPSSSPEKPSLNTVTSVFRTISDVCVLPSMTCKSPTASASTSSSVSTLLSFVPAVLTGWRSGRSASDDSSSTTLATFSFASVSPTTSALPPRQAGENAINNVHTVCSRYQTAVSRSITRGSPYGELILVDILEARGLVLDRKKSGVNAPFIVTIQLSRMSRKTKPAGHDSFTMNERFVFWLPSSSTNDQRTLDIFVRGGDERDVGEVHLSLAMPINETFTDWYPLVCRANGLKHGSIRVTMRRLILTSSSMLEAAINLGERESCLSFSNRRNYGELLPELWSCFPDTAREDNISNKRGSQNVQRDVF